MLMLSHVGRHLNRTKDFCSLIRICQRYSTDSLSRIASFRRKAFQKQLGYRWEQLNPNLVRVHIPSLPYEAYDCYGSKVLPWKMLSLAESVDHNPGWDPTDDTDADGFAMIVTVFLKLEFNQEFYNIESPKYPVFLDLAHDYLRRTSKCLSMSLRHPDVEAPYVVIHSIDVKLDSQTRKPKPYPDSWRNFGIPSESNKSLKHVFPSRPEGVFKTEHKIHYSDTDANRHCNYTFYVRACYDSFHENLVQQNYDSSAGLLMDAGIKTVEVTYKEEVFMGDVITVASWVDPKNKAIYYFDLLCKDATCCMVTFEFFPAKAEGIMSKGRL